MAVSYYSPYIATDEIRIKDAVELLAETGHPVSVSTLERLCRKNGVQMAKDGRANCASWSKLLVLHRDWVNARR
jgi:predicted transcriptional regulator